MSMKLYVGNLSFNTSNQDLNDLFGAIGAVESTNIIEDRETGRSRGFGFVEMASQADGEAAIAQLNGKEVANLDFADRSRIRNQEIGFIFQSFNLIGDLSVAENVELPLTYRTGMPAAERKKRVQESLERVNMAHRMRHYPAQLSGGQQQRVAVARALAGSPSILLADEPTGNLDSKNGEAVMRLLKELHDEGATICMVTHDPRFAAHAERQIHLFDGKVVAEGELSQLMAEV